MSWLGSPFHAEEINGRVEGAGEYKFADGTVFAGELKDGQFHGRGTLRFPNGGRFEGVFQDGRMTSGDYFFADGLAYQPDNWDYCTPATDRRFYSERVKGFAAEPAELGQHLSRQRFAEPLANADQREWIPAGTYDVGDGYYDPSENRIYAYPSTYRLPHGSRANSSTAAWDAAGAAKKLVTVRVPTSDETLWILANCRFGDSVSSLSACTAAL